MHAALLHSNAAYRMMINKNDNKGKQLEAARFPWYRTSRCVSSTLIKQTIYIYIYVCVCVCGCVCVCVLRLKQPYNIILFYYY